MLKQRVLAVVICMACAFLVQASAPTSPARPCGIDPGDHEVIVFKSSIAHISAIPLPVCEPGPLYRNAMLGVRIKRVLVDGFEIPSTPAAVFFDDMDMSTVDMGEEWFVYVVRRDRFLFFGGELSSPTIIGFDLTGPMSELVIEYSVTTPDGREPRFTYTLVAN